MKKNWWSDADLIGVDEVGRGCLAGPVFAAAVRFRSQQGVQDFMDSKALSAQRREELARVILEHHDVGIAFATVEEIEEFNILGASFLAMVRAIEKLGARRGHVVVDGKLKIRGLSPLFQQTALIKGDSLVPQISAASIVAKVTRDGVMTEMSKLYPLYGFEVHKGYSTQIHKKALSEWGPCPQHRKYFHGVREFYPELFAEPLSLELS